MTSIWKKQFDPRWWLVVLPATAVLLYLLFPSVGSREPSKRAVCSNNLKGIGQGLAIYAHDHDGRFPDRLSDLIKEGSCEPKQFICPKTDVWNDMTAQVPTDSSEAAAWVDAFSMYHYCGSGHKLSDFAPDDILAWEEPRNHGDGANVLFGDIQVKFIKATDLPKLFMEHMRALPSTQPATQP